MCVSNIASMCYKNFAKSMTHLTHKSPLGSRGKGLSMGHSPENDDLSMTQVMTQPILLGFAR